MADYGTGNGTGVNLAAVILLTILLVAGPYAPGAVRSQGSSRPSVVTPTASGSDPLPMGAIARLGTTRFRRQRGIDNVSFSPDNHLVASTNGYELFLWDRSTGRLVRTLQDVQRTKFLFGRYAFTRDGSAIVSTDWGEVFLVSDVATGKELRRWQGAKTGLSALALSQNGLVAVADRDGVIRVWDTLGVKAAHTVPHTGGGPLRSLAFTADSTRLAVVGRDIRLVRLETGEVLQRVANDDAGYAALSPDGRTAAAFSVQEGLRVGDISTGKERRLLRGDGTFLYVGCCPDGKTVVAHERAGDSYFLRLWDVETGRGRRVKLLGEVKYTEGPVVLSADHKMVALRDLGRNLLQVWDAQTGRPVLIPPGHTYPPRALAFAPHGRILTSYAFSDGVIEWDLVRARPVHIEALDMAGRPSLDFRVRVSKDGAWVAQVEARRVRVYDIRSRKVGRDLRWTAGDAVDLAFSPTGDRVALACSDGRIHVWEMPSGKPARIIDTKPHGSAVSWILFTPDGRCLATGNGTMWEGGSRAGPVQGPLKLHLWDAATGTHQGVITANPDRWKDTAFSDDWQCCFSPDGRFLFMSNCGELLIWDIGRRREADPYEPVPIAAWTSAASGTVAVSPDGRILARIDETLTLGLWETGSGKQVYRFARHWFEGAFSSLAFGPNPNILATGYCEDGSVLLWDLLALYRAGATGNGVARDLLWKDLAAQDAPLAYRALGRLTADQGIVDFLASRLNPVPAPEPGRVSRLLRELDNPDFATRERAAKDLEEMGESALIGLESASRAEGAEIRRRASALLGLLSTKSPLRIREVRAVQILEYVGTDSARDLLRRLASGGPGAVLTTQAQASLGRLDRRPGRMPR